MKGIFSQAPLASKIVRIGNKEFRVSHVDDLDSLLEAKTEGELTQTCPFGGVIWPSSVAFCRWVAKHLDFRNHCETKSHGETYREFDLAKETEKRLFADFKALLSTQADLKKEQKQDQTKPTRALIELGCGVGLAGLYVAQALRCHAILTDFEPSLEPIVARNATSFHVTEFHTFKTLDWKNPTLDWQILAPHSNSMRTKVILAADVLYENEHIDLVPKIAAELMRATGAELFILADPERYRYESAVKKLHETFDSVQIVTLPTVENESSDYTQGKVHLHFCKRLK